MDLKGSKTEKNLMEAFAGESQARNKYTYYASKAKKDGYVQIAKFFEETANNEKEQEWECNNCGFHIESKCAPEICPICAHPKSYFEIDNQNY